VENPFVGSLPSLKQRFLWASAMARQPYPQGKMEKKKKGEEALQPPALLPMDYFTESQTSCPF